ncbi:hypothetical protein [Streptomyces glaucescens]|uniref:hypothetical protein n=1 Tax=Streptomyces glaucescens TaxID=1907 RepID=UPI0005B77B7A|nr:hypothetical protein [Streptomyces glaucescens]
MRRTAGEGARIPIYEELVRERGDAVAEARTAAERIRLQAARLLGGQRAVRPLARAGESAD